MISIVFLFLLPQTRHESALSDFNTVLDAVHARLKEEPRDGKFGLSRAILPHGREPSKTALGDAFRNLKTGYRPGIFARALVPKKGSKMAQSGLWYLGTIPAGAISSKVSLSPTQLESQVIAPVLKTLASSKENQIFQSPKASTGWKYEVLARKVFPTSASCSKCHVIASSKEPMAVIGIARTSWPPTKAK